MLVCALSFDSQLSCVFYLLNVSQFSQMFSLPLLLIASTIFPALLDLTSQKRHLKPIHRWCSGTNQSTAWIATWNQPARLPHIPCRPCKALGTSQTNLLCSRKKQQHEPSHPQWTCCSPKSGLFACHHASKADNTSQKRHLKPIHRWCSGTNQSTAWIATWNQPARLPHIPCRPCKALGTSQTNLLCSRKKQQHEPSHPQWTCCSPKSVHRLSPA